MPAHRFLRENRLFKPIGLVFDGFRADGNMAHGRIFARAVPVFDIGRAPNDIARLDDLHGFTPFLRAPLAGNNHQILSVRMAVPIGHGASGKLDQRSARIAVTNGRQPRKTRLAAEMLGWRVLPLQRLIIRDLLPGRLCLGAKSLHNQAAG